jgi:hypothetical protein
MKVIVENILYCNNVKLHRDEMSKEDKENMNDNE